MRKKIRRTITDEQVLEAAGEQQEKLHVTKNKGGIIVKGIHDVAARFSKCCSPIPGDEIVGFVTRGRGITIHRTDCVNVLNMSEADRSRLIEAEWQPVENKGSEKYMADLQVFANNRTVCWLIFPRSLQNVRLICVRSTVVPTSRRRLRFPLHLRSEAKKNWLLLSKKSVRSRVCWMWSVEQQADVIT